MTTLQYDGLNRLTDKTYSSCPSSVASTATVTYTYDTGTNGKGRRTSMGVAGGDYTSWNYDLRGRVLSENKQIIPSGGQFVTSFTYNTADLPVTMTYPSDNEVVTFQYNNDKLPVNVAGTNTYAQSIDYDSANRITQIIRGANKIGTNYTYRPWNQQGGRLQNITSTRVSPSDPLQNLTYSYDAVGNITTITDSLSGPQTQTFVYDELDRLTKSTVTGGTDGVYVEKYTYDPATGNLLTKGDPTMVSGAEVGRLKYKYDASQDHAVSSLVESASESTVVNSYDYDANGNMDERAILSLINGQPTTLAYDLKYDAENRLESVTGAATASFTYDGDGKQVKAIVNGVTAVYVGDHYEVKNNVVSKYYFVGATRLAVRTDGTLRFLLGDHLGSSSVTTNASGAKTASALYKAFGETRFTSGTLYTDYKFTGQREQSELGIYWFSSRWMDPQLGRFIQADTITPPGPQGYDRYAYADNNPIRLKDPSGHSSTSEDSGNCETDEDGCDYRDPQFWINLILAEFGITMALGAKAWTLTNLMLMHWSLQNINNAMGGNLRDYSEGWTIRMQNYSGKNEYEGNTSHLDQTIDFYTKGDAILRQMNIFHEFGHLVDTNDTFSNLLASEDKRNWVDTGSVATGKVSGNALIDNRVDQFSYSQGAQAIQASKVGAVEIWADAFANFVAGNIDLSTDSGSDMYDFVHDALY